MNACLILLLAMNWMMNVIFEQQVVLNIRNFILQMDKGFCFIGNQYQLEMDGDEFFIDLLFFNRYLQCLVAFD
jgi:predicted nuclease of restriction endonuclease-like (RecB) superfamily